jgi:hypothetical protein
MIIKKQDPLVIPATEEAVYPDIWLHDIRIETPPGGPGRATVAYSSWQADSVNTAKDTKQFFIDDLMGKLEADPDFRAAWDGMTAIINKYMVEAGIAAAPDPE